MPHIVIEHPKCAQEEIDLSSLAKELHNLLAEQETVVKKSIKTRTVQVDNVIIGEEQTDNKFIHIALMLLPGRSVELKEIIVERIYKKTQQIVGDEYILSVEIRDLGVYFKG